MAEHLRAFAVVRLALAVEINQIETKLGTLVRNWRRLCLEVPGGTTGLMPTFGRVPKFGCVPLAYSLDHIGPMARSARDCALMLQVLAGYDPSDVTSLDMPVPDYLRALTGDLTGLRIGIDRLARVSGDAEDPALPAVFEDAVAVLADRGAGVEEVELPYFTEMTAASMVIMLSEALAYHLPDLRKHWSDYSAGTRTMVAAGAFYSGADYVQAQRVRRVAQRALATLFDEFDLVVTPTSGAGALSISELAKTLEVIKPDAFGPIHTQFWNAVGSPVAAIPVGFTADGLPLGLQLAGRPYDEATVLRAADAYQQATDWHLQRPPLAAPTR